MEWPFQCPDGRSNGRMHIGKRGSGHTRRKRGRVQLVVGVQNQGNIESALRRARGLGAVQHEQEIGRVREIPVRLDNVFPLADAIVSSHDHGNLRGQANRLVNVGIVVILLKFGIVERQRRDRRS